jgi:hypothetical protein
MRQSGHGAVVRFLVGSAFARLTDRAKSWEAGSGSGGGLHHSCRALDEVPWSETITPHGEAHLVTPVTLGQPGGQHERCV